MKTFKLEVEINPLSGNVAVKTEGNLNKMEIIGILEELKIQYVMGRENASQLH